MPIAWVIRARPRTLTCIDALAAVLGDNPYFAVTKADGSFEIANLPAGVELEFRVWQEKAKYLREVTVGGESQKWSKGRFSLTLEPDQAENLEVAIPAAAFN